MAARRLARLAWLTIFLLTLSALVTAAAPSRAAAADLTITTNSATADFPSQITFHLVASAPQPVTAVETRYHAAYTPVIEVIRPAFSGGSQIDVTATLDMRSNYLPPGIDVIYSWRITFQDGATFDTPEQALFYMDGRHSWRTLTQGQVTLYYYSGNESFGQEALATTVKAIDQFKQRFAVTANEPVRVVLYGSNRDFADALPPNSSEWIGGFTDPELHLVATGIQPGTGATTEIHRVLSHEVVHLIIAQATANPFNSPPPWLDEGLASYYQEIQDTRFPRILKTAVQSGTLIPLRALYASFPDDPDLALLSYAESESVVQFIIEQKGQDRMAALINVFRDGVSYDQAVQKSLGLSLDELDRQWKDWLGYQGDKPATAHAPSSPGNGNPVERLPELLAHIDALTYAAIALLCLVTGAIILTRVVTARREQ